MDGFSDNQPFAYVTADVKDRANRLDDVYVLSTYDAVNDALIGHSYSGFTASRDALGFVRTAANVNSADSPADGSVMTLYDITNVLNGGLDYVQLGKVSEPAGRTTLLVMGTRLTHGLRTMGTATYRGGTRGYYVAAGGARYETAGDMQLTAVFGTDSVTGSASNFRFMNEQGAAVSSPANLDFTFTARISLARFSGSATGGDMTGAVAGDFYGEPSGAPAEVGALYRLSGTDGSFMRGVGGLKRE